MSKKKTELNTDLNDTLDSIIIPLQVSIVESVNNLISGKLKDPEFLKILENCLAVAVLRGTEISDNYNKKLDDAREKADIRVPMMINQEIEKTHNNAIAALNMQNKTGMVNRFVSPLDFDKNGDYKAKK